MVKAAIYHKLKRTYTEDDVQAAIAYYKAGHCNNISHVADKFGVLFAIIYEVFMVLQTMLNKTSSILLTPRSMCCAIGLSTEVELAAHSVNGPFFIRLKKSLGRSPLQNGTGDFSNDTLTYDLVNLLALTLNELNALTELQLTSIFKSLGRLWMRRTYHGATSTIWMRKGVSKVEAEEYRILSISFHTIDGRAISCAVLTWSWSQLLSASVQMGQACYLDLYSLERNFILNGSWMWMRELGKICLQLSLYTWLIFMRSVGMSENGWTDDFLCMQWFQESFIPQAMACNTSGAPILLIYDGHSSHTTEEM